MEQNNSKTAAIVGIILVVVLALGVWVWSMSNDEGETETAETSQVSDDTASQESSQQDIVGTASDTESLSTLVTALTAADLVETLQGDGPFTVFAPTNAAFDKLPDGTLDDLLMPENKEQLASILTYHVVSGKVMSTDLTDGQVVKTVQGENLTVEITDAGVYVVDATGGKAMVSTADVEATNGVVHIIDSVLLPA